MKGLLTTQPEDPLHIVAFISGCHLTGIYIVGDTVVIKPGIRTVECSVFTLLSAYYVFNVDYPRQYSMVLAALQCLTLEEPYLKVTSKKYAFLIKKMKKATEEMAESSDGENQEEPPKKKASIEPTEDDIYCQE